MKKHILEIESYGIVDKYDEWVVYCDEFKVYGAGKTEKEAMEDLYLVMNEVYNHYKNIPDEMIKENFIEIKKIKKYMEIDNGKHNRNNI